MEYDKIQLMDIGQRYLLSRLANGKSLSQQILKVVTFSANSFFTYLPSDLDESYISHFDRAGIADYDICYTFFSRYISAFLCSNKNIVIFEDSNAEKGDAYVSSAKSNILYFNDEVYHLLKGTSNSEKMIETTINEASNAWLNIAIFSATSFECKNPLTEVVLNDLAKNVQKIFIDAYDLDGYVFWEK